MEEMICVLNWLQISRHVLRYYFKYVLSQRGFVQEDVVENDSASYFRDTLMPLL